MSTQKIGVWFPTIRAGTGADVFTIRLAQSLQKRGIQTEITWLPHHAEYAPWVVPVPVPPAWATVVHVNSWLHERFIPPTLPCVVTTHHCVHDPLLTPYKNLGQRLYHNLWIRQREAKNLCQAKVRTAVSTYTSRRTKDIFSCPELTTIHNWVDEDVFFPAKVRQPHAPFRLLFVGSMSRRKGVDLLGKIMQLLGDDFELRCACPPEQLHRTKQCTENIIATGRMHTEHALADLYRASDALLFPSRLEGFGLVAVEAQSCGIPVLATEGSSFPEVVVDRLTGLLCPQDDISAFANAARKLRTNSELWRTMCQAAHKRAREHFNEEKALRAYLRIYQALSARCTHTGSLE